MNRSELESLLPMVFQRTLGPGRRPAPDGEAQEGDQQAGSESNPLGALLDVMEGMVAPIDDSFATLPQTLDPLRTPDDFVPYLAQWVDLDLIEHDRVDPHKLDMLRKIPLLGDLLAGFVGFTSKWKSASDLGRLRELTAWASYLAKWRGTNKGLRLLLVVATGRDGFQIEEPVLDARGRVQPFHIRVRSPAVSKEERGLIERIVDSQKPAHVTYELRYSDSRAGDSKDTSRH